MRFNLVTLTVAATLLACSAAPAQPTTAPAAPDDAEAIRLYARGDYPAVVRLLDPTHRAGQANIQQRLLLARALLHLDRPADGLAVLKSVLKADSENPEANRLAGRVLFDAGRFQEALDYLKQAWRLKRDPFTASMLGRCHYATGETAKAKEFLTIALKQDIRNPANSLLLGKICLARGAGALAEKYLLMAEEAGLDTPELHRLLGRAYLLQRKFVGPVLARRLAGRPAPGDVTADGYLVLGKLDHPADHYQVTTRYCALYEGLGLLKGDAKGKVHADALLMAASGWLSAGQYAPAEQYLNTLASAEGATRQVAALRARLLIATGRFAALEKVLAGARAAKTLDAAAAAEFYYQAALVLRAQGKHNAALAMLKRADAAVPTSARVLRALGALSLATGRREAARRCYARLVELFPDAADIDELRNILRNLTETEGATDATSLPDDPGGD